MYNNDICTDGMRMYEDHSMKNGRDVLLLHFHVI